MHARVSAKSIQSCSTLCNPTDGSPPVSSAHGDSPGRNTGVGCHALLQGIFPPRDQTRVSCVSCIAGGFFTTEPLGKSRWFVINVLYYVEMCSLYTHFECFYHEVVEFCLQSSVLCTENNLSYLFYAYNLQCLFLILIHYPPSALFLHLPVRCI